MLVMEGVPHAARPTMDTTVDCPKFTVWLTETAADQNTSTAQADSIRAICSKLAGNAEYKQ